MTDKDKMRSKALAGEHLCIKHQGNHSHYAEHNCAICQLQAAKESDRKELEAAKQRIADLCENKLANDQANYYQVSKLVDERDTLKAEKEALEKKLAEQQASFRFMCEWLAGTKLPESKGEEELTKLLAAAEQRGRMDERNTAKIFTEQEAFNQGKQAGRDELQKELSELRAVWVSPYSVQKAIDEDMCDDAILWGDNRIKDDVPLIPRPLPPK